MKRRNARERERKEEKTIFIKERTRTKRCKKDRELKTKGEKRDREKIEMPFKTE